MMREKVVPRTIAVHPEKCVGCTTCMLACSFIKTQMFIPSKAKIVIDWEDYKPKIAFIDTCYGIVAPCKYACPVDIDIPRYVRLIGERRFSEALAVVREKVPFPGVLGRICNHPCEIACGQAAAHEPISIKALKRFAAENDDGQWKRYSTVVPSTGKKVAIVGSGPAGLTAAYYLTKLGHSVTVFEELPVIGGMMRVGMPDYRLPRDILDAEINEIKNIGVDITANTKIESVDALFEQGYDATFLALGAHCGIRLEIEGEDIRGVLEGASFLRKVNLGEKINLGNSVAVIGGGNAAVDSARTALRLSAKKVTIIYRRTRNEMLAYPEEVEAAISEGVEIIFLAAPESISLENGRLRLTYIRMKLDETDNSGRRYPLPIKGSASYMDFDSIIAAIGQAPDIPRQFSLRKGSGNTLQVDSETLATNRQGVYAGGDVVTGPASVVEAIAAGRRAAISIDRYLDGSGNINEVLVPRQQFIPYLGEYASVADDRSRAEMPALAVEQRIGNFAEVELGLNEQAAIEEAKRCLNCDECDFCAKYCIWEALTLNR